RALRSGMGVVRLPASVALDERICTECVPLPPPVDVRPITDRLSGRTAVPLGVEDRICRLTGLSIGAAAVCNHVRANGRRELSLQRRAWVGANRESCIAILAEIRHREARRSKGEPDGLIATTGRERRSP